MADMQAQLEAAKKGQQPPHVNMEQADSATLNQVGGLAQNTLPVLSLWQQYTYHAFLSLSTWERLNCSSFTGLVS